MPPATETSANTNPGKFIFAVYTIVVLILNAIIISDAFSKGGWGALGLLLIVAPIVNGITMVADFITAYALGRRYGGVAAGNYWILSFFLPLVCIIIELFILFSNATGGNGC